ncbi:MAG: DUF1501 domain-containing protein [Planctomycetaceae bacterium]|nr:DUF1501 domain-containing protein [Planctomycetaceae bacterium]
MQFTRRDFLGLTVTGSAIYGLGSTAPRFLAHAAERAGEQDRVLVVIQLSGGNDGLNTVIPFRHDVYRKSRPQLALAADRVLKIDDELGFHPELTGLARLLEAGELAIVQGVGYPNPNRSHFESMDIWHTCQRKTDQRLDGWLGRAIDRLQHEPSSDAIALHLGEKKQPFALTSQHWRVPSVRSLEQFRLQGNQETQAQTIKQLVESKRSNSSDLLDFVQSSTATAVDVSQRFDQIGKSYQPKAEYPESALGQKLKTVAQLIDAGLSTRIYYVEVDGFDTHAQQAPAHESLLREVGNALAAFTTDMGGQGQGDRVLSVCFSEFGRRVQENASSGTDHGTAGPMILAGAKVKAGLIGEHPSLTDLEQGDLKFHTDFRQVYAGILEQWLECESPSILGGEFEPVSLIDG